MGVGLGSRRRGVVRRRQAARALSPAGRPGPARQSQAVEVLNRAPLCPRSAPDAEHRPPPVAVTNAVADAPFGDAHPRHERDELTARHDCDPGGAGVIAAREVKESLDGFASGAGSRSDAKAGRQPGRWGLRSKPARSSQPSLGRSSRPRQCHELTRFNDMSGHRDHDGHRIAARASRLASTSSNSSLKESTNFSTPSSSKTRVTSP